MSASSRRLDVSLLLKGTLKERASIKRKTACTKRSAMLPTLLSSAIQTSDIAELEAAAKARVKLLTNGEIKHGDRNKRVEIIQLALATVTDLRGCEPGKWDAITAAACSRYQRMIGYVGKDVSGLPDVNMLRRLARETGLFRIDA
jgi:hypothetical protein